ncbi:MAG TPA: serine/threonine-protein kinase, partial [Burkholderiales bacterium]|nr:serine/threonine-protein kinase [Burkholderiales bacterium]
MAVFTRIGKYEVRRQLGRGAMGVVFEAFDPTIERRVAIKTLRLEVFESSQLADVRARFKREAQLAGRMSHPHIVTVHDYGEHEGTPYIVMEYMGGQELSAILQKGARLPLSEAVRLMTQLLGALAYAHEHKVVHRDIKPGNIFVLEDGSLKVVDFGIARMEASNLTDTGAMLGTPAYMSPEQFLAMPVDERSDIFSAGVIFYELLTGDKPFTGSVTTIMQKVLRQEPIEPSVLNPLIAAAWDVVVKRAMAKKPEARFSSARQFSETIKQVFDARSAHISI